MIHIALVMAAFIAAIYMIPAFVGAILRLAIYLAIIGGVVWIVGAAHHQPINTKEIVQTQQEQQIERLKTCNPVPDENGWSDCIIEKKRQEYNRTHQD